jgi:hypothetical protein
MQLRDNRLPEVGAGPERKLTSLCLRRPKVRREVGYPLLLFAFVSRGLQTPFLGLFKSPPQFGVEPIPARAILLPARRAL